MSLTFHLIPHTHWDREWFLTRATYQARLVPVLDEALDQLERDTNARFLLDGQTILLEDYLAVRPENEARIDALVKRGALEIGPWYVLSDLLIPSAASLRRNLEEGTRDSARFGKRLDVLYSPDAFGHPGWLPQLAAEFGIRRGVIRRGLGLPWDFYRWETPTGEHLLVHHLRKGGYDIAVDLAEAGSRLSKVWKPIRLELVKHAVTDEIAVFLGADHHAMMRDVSALCASLQALEPNSRVRISGLTEFFDAAERAGAEFPVVRGELRRGGEHTWVLQDVHSARSRVKRHHGRAESELSRIAEPLVQLAGGKGGIDREGLLRLAWRTLLQCQFHDTLAGTTSDEVQLEQTVRLNAVQSLASELSRTNLNELIGHDPDSAREHPEQVVPSLVLWNATDHSRSGVMAAELSFFATDVLVGPPTGKLPRVGAGYHPFVLVTPSGDLIPIQVIRVEAGDERIDAMRHYPDQDAVDKVTIAFAAPQLIPGEVLRLTTRVSDVKCVDEGLEVTEGLLSNRFVTVSISETGEITLADKQSGKVFNRLCQLQDEGDSGDLYTFSSAVADDECVAEARSQAIVTSGPLVGSIETKWCLRSLERGEIGLRLLVTLYADAPIVRLRLDIENRAVNHRLRARFPIGGRGAIAGAAIGVEHREPVLPDVRIGSIEREVRTAPAHGFVAAAEGKRGLAICQPNFFEYEATAGGDILVTLVRSVGQLSRNDLPERLGHAAWPVATPDAQEQGTHSIEMTVVPVEEAAIQRPGELERLAEAANVGVRAVFVRDYVTSPRSSSPKRRSTGL